MFGGAAAFQEKLGDVVEFFKTLPSLHSLDAADASSDDATRKHFQDIQYHGNIMLFYLRGEYEKITGARRQMKSLLDDSQTAVYNAIFDKIDDFMRLIQNASGDADYSPIVESLYGIYNNMEELAANLDKDGRGGTIRYIANEVKNMADSVKNYKGTVLV
jgi:hypothetical protein